MSSNPLLIDVDCREVETKLQPKVTYAGDVWEDQPYAAVTQDSILLSCSKEKGAMAMSEQFGITMTGPVSFSVMPDQITIGGGYWKLNPLLLSCIPSTTPTPIPTLVPTTPKLLISSDDLSSVRDNLISNSDAA